MWPSVDGLYNGHQSKYFRLWDLAKLVQFLTLVQVLMLPVD